MGGFQRIAICTGLLLAASACGADARNIRAAKDLVREELLDGSSAQFEDVVSSTITDGRSLVCGWVNGKNRLGAYTGFEKFLVVDGALKQFGPTARSGYEGTFGACIAGHPEATARMLRDVDRAFDAYEEAVRPSSE